MNQLNNKILVLSKAACNIQAQEDHIQIKYIYRTEQEKKSCKGTKLNITSKKKRRRTEEIRLSSFFGSPCWIRTGDPSVNSRMLYR